MFVTLAEPWPEGKSQSGVPTKSLCCSAAEDAMPRGPGTRPHCFARLRHMTSLRTRSTARHAAIAIGAALLLVGATGCTAIAGPDEALNTPTPTPTATRQPPRRPPRRRPLTTRPRAQGLPTSRRSCSTRIPPSTRTAWVRRKGTPGTASRLVFSATSRRLTGARWPKRSRRSSRTSRGSGSGSHRHRLRGVVRRRGCAHGCLRCGRVHGHHERLHGRLNSFDDEFSEPSDAQRADAAMPRPPTACHAP